MKMSLRLFLKMSAMLGLMAAPVIRLFEKPKRKYIASARLDDLIGLRFFAPEGICLVSGFCSKKEWELIEYGDFKNKVWIVPVGEHSPKVLMCFSGMLDNEGFVRFHEDFQLKFYRPN